MKLHRLSWEIIITTMRTMWACFHLGTGHFSLWAQADGENPEVSWEKKQFHIDNAATTELHLAFADKSVPVTKEFSTPQAICAVHWTSESQQAPRHTRGIFVIMVEGIGSGGARWARGPHGHTTWRAAAELHSKTLSKLWQACGDDTNTW